MLSHYGCLCKCFYLYLLDIILQLVDDLLDFTSCDAIMGKPTAADLRLGLATASVLFAAYYLPEF